MVLERVQMRSIHLSTPWNEYSPSSLSNIKSEHHKKSRKNVREACAALFFIIFLQTIAYQILWDMKFLARNLALCGAVCLLLAEVTGETRTIFAGVPTLDDNNPKNMLQLSGTNNKIIC